MQVEENAEILGHDKQGQAISLGSYRRQFDAALKAMDEGKLADENSAFNEETWGLSPEAQASQQSLLSLVGGGTLQLGQVEGDAED